MTQKSKKRTQKKRVGQKNLGKRKRLRKIEHDSQKYEKDSEN